MDDPISISISRAEALVLFDLLYGFRDESHLAIRHDAERVTLWMIEACLEKTLADPFSDEYHHLVEEARAKVLAKWGVPLKPPSA